LTAAALDILSTSSPARQAMTKPASPQPLARILAADTTIAAWHLRAQAEAELTLAVRRHLPRALAERVHVAEVANATLTLATSAGAIAAVVRQRLPTILGELTREGRNFTEIRVRVQVRSDSAQVAKPLKIQRKSVDPAPLNRLADRLPEGPLKAAVQKLARRL
jgi:hypothetical protein